MQVYVHGLSFPSHLLTWHATETLGPIPRREHAPTHRLYIPDEYYDQQSPDEVYRSVSDEPPQRHRFHNLVR